MYYLLGTCIALASLLALNALLTLIATVVWRGLKRPAREWSATTRAKILFTLRTLPPASALFITAVLLVPAYVLHEPYAKAEVPGVTLLLLALVSATGITFALLRLASSWLSTRRLNRDWLRRADLVSIKSVNIPAYRLRHSFPVIAVVGTLRPRLFVADRIFDLLNEEEMAAAVAHERGHLVACDTLKRTALRACRDLLLFAPIGRRFDAEWAEESERAADEYAVRDDAGVALDLAAVLIKLARLVPGSGKPSIPAAAFLIEATHGGIAGRVRRLTELAADGRRRERYEAVSLGAALAGGGSAVTSAAALSIVNPQTLATTHVLIEHVISVLR